MNETMSFCISMKHQRSFSICSLFFCFFAFYFKVVLTFSYIHLADPKLLFMRNRLSFCTTLLLYCLLISTTVQSQLQKLYLNPKTPAREKQSKFIDSLRFIPLKVKEGVSAGASYNTYATDKYFLLVDYLNKVLRFYSKTGDFVKEIKYSRLGGNFYPNYREASNQIMFLGDNKNYTLTEKDRIKIKLDWDNPRNRKYFKKYTIDLNDPSLTIKKDIPDEKDILQVYHYYGDYYLQLRVAVSPLNKDSLNHELKLYKNNQLVKSFFPYNPVREPRFLYTEETVASIETDTPHIHFITRPYCDTVYKMIKDSLFPAYQLVLPLENSLPSSFFTKPFKNKTERDNFNQNNGWIFHQVYDFHETPQFIFFLVAYLSNYDAYIYEKSTNVTYKTKNIKPDSSQYNLQLLGDFGVTRKGDRSYKPQKAADFISFFEENKNVPVPKELESFLKSKPPGTTPVIVEFKFKN